MEILELPLTSIEVGADRARELDPAWVEGLAGSIREQGLMQPIVVRKVDAGYRLIAGYHRVEAFRLLDRDIIPAMLSDATSDDAAKLAEVMENLGRNELIAFDRCRHLYELKQIYDRLHPDASKPGRRANGKTFPISDAAATDCEVFGFAADVAEQIGLSKRAINMAVKIWSGLVPTVRKRLVGTDTATKQTELKALSELPATKQIKVLDAILDRQHPEIGNVAQALAYLGENVVCDPLEKRFATVSKSIADLDDDTFDSVIAAHEDRVIQSLQRRGRI